MSGHPPQQQLPVESKYQTPTPVPPIPPVVGYGHQMGPGGGYGHFAAVSQPQPNQSYVLPPHAYVYGNGEPLAKQMKLEPSSHVVNNPAENSFPQVPAVSSTTRPPVNGPVTNMHQQQQLPHHMQPQSQQQQQQQLSHQQPQPQQPLQPQQQQQPHHPHPHHPHAQPQHNQHHMTVVPVMHQQLVHHQQQQPHQQTVVPSLPQQQQPAPITNNNDWDQSQTLAGGGSLSPGGDSSNGNEKSAKKKRKRCGECPGCLKKDNCGDCGPCKSVRSHQICKMRKCDQLKTKKEKARESKNQTAQLASATAQGNTSGIITTTTADASPEAPVNGLRDVSSPPNHRSTPVLNGGSSGPYASESNAQLHTTAVREPPPPQPPIPQQQQQQQHPTADMNGGGDVANRHQIMNNRLKTMIQNRQNNKTNFESYQNFCNGNQRPPSQNGVGDPFHTSAANGNNNLNGGMDSHEGVNGGGDNGSNGGMDDQQRLHHQQQQQQQQQQQSQYEQDQQSFLLNTTTSSNISISTASTMMMSSYDGEYYGHDMDVECGRSLTQFDSGSTTGTSLLDLSDSVVHRYDHTSTTVPPLPPVSTLMMPGWWSS